MTNLPENSTPSQLRLRAVLLAAIVLAALLPRLWCLDADSVAARPFGNGDEGTHSFNTRNMVLNGEFRTDSFNPMLAGPLYAQVQYAASKLWNRPIVRYRMASVVSSVLLVLLTALVLRRDLGFPLQALACLYMGGNYLLLLHSRMGNPEMTLALFMALAVSCAWVSQERASPALGALAGVLAGCAYFIKATGLVLAPILIFGHIACVLAAGKAERKKRRLTALISAAALAATLYTGFVFALQPHYMEWRSVTDFFLKTGADPARISPAAVPANLLDILRSPAWASMPFLALLALVRLAVFARAIPRRETTPRDWFLFFWLSGVLLLLALFDYHPIRWQMLLAIPVIWTGFLGLADPAKGNLPAWVTFAVAVLGAAYAFTCPIAFHGRTLWIIACAAFATILAVSAWKQAKPATLAAILATLALALQADLSRDILGHRSYTLRDTAQHLETLAQGRPVSGDVAMLLALGMDHTPVIPTYQLALNPSDQAYARLYKRTGPPVLYLCIDFNINRLAARSPKFASTLRHKESLRLSTGHPDQHTFYLFEYIPSEP